MNLRELLRTTETSEFPRPLSGLSADKLDIFENLLLTSLLSQAARALALVQTELQLRSNRG
jgi:hypothetical protein